MALPHIDQAMPAARDAGLSKDTGPPQPSHRVRLLPALVHNPTPRLLLPQMRPKAGADEARARRRSPPPPGVAIKALQQVPCPKAGGGGPVQCERNPSRRQRHTARRAHLRASWGHCQPLSNCAFSSTRRQISLARKARFSAFSPFILLAPEYPSPLANFCRRGLYFHFHSSAIRSSSISYDLHTIYH